MLISVELPLYSAHCYWMYPAELLMNRRIRTRLDVLRPDLRKKVTRPNRLQPSTPTRQLTVGDPVLVQDYRKSRDPWSKGVIVSKLGPVTYRLQVDSFFGKGISINLKICLEPSYHFQDKGKAKLYCPKPFQPVHLLQSQFPHQVTHL